MRCMLFTPGIQYERAKNAWKYDPDAVILDLEDTIPPSNKSQAREITRKVISEEDKNWYVRINSLSSEWWEEDLNSVVHPNLKGLLIPKANDPRALKDIDDLLGKYELEQGISNKIKLIPIIETVKGLDNVREISRSSDRIQALAFGEVDFSLDLGIDWDPTSLALTVAKVMIVLESRLAGLEKPHDGAYPVLHDEAGLRSSCLRAKSLGFGAKHCIHPEQIPVVKEVFAPSKEMVERSVKIVKEFERAMSGGIASISVDNQLVDYAVYKRALQVIAEGEKK